MEIVAEATGHVVVAIPLPIIEGIITSFDSGNDLALEDFIEQLDVAILRRVERDRDEPSA